MPKGREKPSQRISHPERAERRRQMALEVKQGASLAAVALRYQVTLPTVRNACLEHEVHWKGRHTHCDDEVVGVELPAVR
ncbi:MAG TPA: hypothetical protein VG125_33805 [Pirellulales bacterium]|jgi:hypothetical protein|nr:hypothetical protein [Pirellulales bacterium]